MHSFPTFVVLLLLSTPGQIFSEEELIRVISSSAKDVHFFSHADGKPVVEVIYDDKHSFEKSYIQSPSQSKRTTVLLIGGFQSNNNTAMLIRLAKAYTSSTAPRYNVITVGWTKLSGIGNPVNEATFSAAVANVKNAVGPRVADFIGNLLKFKDIPVDTVHIVGFDLGAHAAGVAGRKVYAKQGTRVKRIAGLDPAAKRFDVATAAIAVKKTDATFVDLYHTDIGRYGTVDDNGHVNIYVNGAGRVNHPQPACDTDTCNHHYSWKFFLAFTTTYKACPCEGSGYS